MERHWIPETKCWFDLRFFQHAKDKHNKKHNFPIHDYSTVTGMKGIHIMSKVRGYQNEKKSLRIIGYETSKFSGVSNRHV